MIGLPHVDKIVISDDSAISNSSLILSVPASCALYLSSDVKKIKIANVPLFMWNLNMYVLKEGTK